MGVSPQWIEDFANFLLCFKRKIVLLHPSNAIAMRSENREKAYMKNFQRSGFCSFLDFTLI